QHGGQETTITSFHSTLLHQGMIIVGLPCAFPGLTNMDEITGGSPYGASTLAKGDGSRRPGANELDGPPYPGKHAAPVRAKLTGGHCPPGGRRGDAFPGDPPPASVQPYYFSGAIQGIELATEDQGRQTQKITFSNVH